MFWKFPKKFYFLFAISFILGCLANNLIYSPGELLFKRIVYEKGFEDGRQKAVDETRPTIPKKTATIEHSVTERKPTETATSKPVTTTTATVPKPTTPPTTARAQEVKPLPTTTTAIKNHTSRGTPIQEDENYLREIISTMDVFDIIRSTAISRIGYSEVYEVLLITFLESGASYLYYGVPYEEFDNLYNADSIGRYFNQNIKGYYDVEKIY